MAPKQAGAYKTTRSKFAAPKLPSGAMMPKRTLVIPKLNIPAKPKLTIPKLVGPKLVMGKSARRLLRCKASWVFHFSGFDPLHFKKKRT